MKNIRYVVKHRRRREFKTNYKKRKKMLSSEKLRMVVRVTLNNIYAQIIQYAPNGDRILLNVKSKDLEKFDWKLGKSNIPTAYLVGLLTAKKTGKQKISEVIVDTGIVSPTKGSKIYSCMKGAIDGGLKIKCTEEKFPSEERISGKHISDYASKKPENFSKTPDAGKMHEIFHQVKNKIMAL